MAPMPRPQRGGSGGGGGGGAGGTPAMRNQAGGSRSVAAQLQQQAAKQQGQQQPQQQQAEMYNTNNWKNNYQAVYFLRIYMTIIAGVVVGVLGITGWQGFAAYIVSQLMVVPLIVIKAAGGTPKYFPSWDKVVLEHVFSSTAVLSYFLCWMVAYNLGHVF